MKKLFGIAIVAALFMSLAPQSFAQTDAFLGTWKLNIKKSKFTPGPPRKGETRVVVTSDVGLRVSVNCINADGSTQDFEYTSNLDGKSYPITGLGPYGADSIAANLTSPTTIQSTLTKNGKVVATTNSSVSPDGKVLTITAKGTNSDGKSFTNVSVYDKQ